MFPPSFAIASCTFTFTNSPVPSSMTCAALELANNASNASRTSSSSSVVSLNVSNSAGTPIVATASCACAFARTKSRNSSHAARRSTGTRPDEILSSNGSAPPSSNPSALSCPNTMFFATDDAECLTLLATALNAPNGGIVARRFARARQ